MVGQQVPAAANCWSAVATSSRLQHRVQRRGEPAGVVVLHLQAQTRGAVVVRGWAAAAAAAERHLFWSHDPSSTQGGSASWFVCLEAMIDQSAAHHVPAQQQALLDQQLPFHPDCKKGRLTKCGQGSVDASLGGAEAPAGIATPPQGLAVGTKWQLQQSSMGF